jgi:hypothetical protein
MKRVLLDHCVPRRVRQALVDCDAATAFKLRSAKDSFGPADTRLTRGRIPDFHQFGPQTVCDGSKGFIPLDGRGYRNDLAE